MLNRPARSEIHGGEACRSARSEAVLLQGSGQPASRRGGCLTDDFFVGVPGGFPPGSGSSPRRPSSAMTRATRMTTPLWVRQQGATPGAGAGFASPEVPPFEGGGAAALSVFFFPSLARLQCPVGAHSVARRGPLAKSDATGRSSRARGAGTRAGCPSPVMGAGGWVPEPARAQGHIGQRVTPVCRVPASICLTTSSTLALTSAGMTDSSRGRARGRPCPGSWFSAKSPVLGRGPRMPR